MAPLPSPSEHARHWRLDPSVVFLNHGSFGAAPTAVLEHQAALRAELEAEPVRFLARELEGRMAEVRAALGAFVGCHPDDLALVSNATAGVNTVLRSLRFEPGDELLTTDHEYNASRNALAFAAAQSGAKVVVAKVPFPLERPDQVTEAVLAKVTDRTRLVLVDHVTSQTGLVFPIAELQRALAPRGVELLVDGAHAPGMLPLHLEQLGVAYYTGNCHKWLCTPKGAALLYVRRDLQPRVRPLSISHGANSARTDVSRFRVEFDWCGTDDPTPWLCIPRAIEVMGSLFPGGWAELQRQNRALALEGRRLLCAALGVSPPAPDEMIGSLATVPLPDVPPGPPVGPLALDPLQHALFERYRIEIPVMPSPTRPPRLLRIAAQAYNSLAQLQYLADALGELGLASRSNA